MIGTGLKKYAEENGLKVAKGIAYGNFRGYAATMREGAGYKALIITTKFTAAGDSNALLAELNAANIQRTYRVQGLNFSPIGISVIFTDTVGTMKRIADFADWFMPLLSTYSATAWNICIECGEEVVDGTWALVNGVAHYLHKDCFAKVSEQIVENEQAQKAQDDGSYATGATGAFLGALLGAVVWAIILCIGYVASVVGLLIGWLANKGYELCQGKKGKGKVVILILAVIVGVVLGTLGGYTVALWNATNEFLAEASMDPLPASYILDVFIDMLADAEMIGYIVKDTLLGLLFAALGVFALIKRAEKEVSGTKIAILE